METTEPIRQMHKELVLRQRISQHGTLKLQRVLEKSTLKIYEVNECEYAELRSDVAGVFQSLNEAANEIEILGEGLFWGCSTYSDAEYVELQAFSATITRSGTEPTRLTRLIEQRVGRQQK